jgi:hypothetical protein
MAVIALAGVGTLDFSLQGSAASTAPLSARMTSAGRMAGQHLNSPITGIVPTADRQGYWLVAKDGGVFAFGDAAFERSHGG